MSLDAPRGLRPRRGRPVRKGYERVVLDRGELPPDFLEAVRALEQAQSDRAQRARELLASPRAGDLVPVLAAATVVERKAVLAEGAFAWGHVLSAPHRPEGIEVSSLVRRLVELCDGRRTIAELATALSGAAPPRSDAGPSPAVDAVTRTLVQALRILYVDGVVADLRERRA